MTHQPTKRHPMITALTYGQRLALVHQIARAHWHDWALRCHLNEVYNLTKAQALALYNERVEACEYSDKLPAGIAPALSHITATGRTSWEVDPSGLVTIEIHRSTGIVIRCETRKDFAGNASAALCVGTGENAPHQRHVSALWECLDAFAGPYCTRVWLAALFANAPLDPPMSDLSNYVPPHDRCIVRYLPNG